MVLALDQRFPVVWRDPHTLQIGVAPPRVVLTDVGTTEERMLAALEQGTSRSMLDLIGGATTAGFLRALEPVLAGPPATTGTVLLHGAGPVVDELAAVLAARRLRVLVGDGRRQRIDLGVVVATGVLPPDVPRSLLRRDLPHLGVVLHETSARVEAPVEPGRTACLWCAELHRTDADPAWPAIAAQLLGRRSGADEPVLRTELVGLVARLVLARLDGAELPPVAIELAADGRRSEHPAAPHPRCGCLGLDRVARGDAVA